MTGMRDEGSGMRERICRVLLCPALLVIALCGCGSRGKQPVAETRPGDSPAATKVRLLLNWYPEAEHGGYYAALVHGYYRDAGLDVEIVKGGPSAPVTQQVDNGQMEFGIANADRLLMARAAPAQLVALLAPIQTSPRCIMVHESSGINDFADLKNMTLAMNADPFVSFLQRELPLTGVTIVPYQGSVAQFLSDDHFGQQGYIFSEPFVAREQGGDPKTLLVADLGFNPYASVLLTSEDYLREHEDVVGKMVAASVEGWRHYLEQPEETNQHIHDINPEMSLEALAYGVEALVPLARGETEGNNQIGEMSLGRWQQLSRQLEELDAIKPGEVDATKAFTTKFLADR